MNAPATDNEDRDAQIGTSRHARLCATNTTGSSEPTAVSTAATQSSTRGSSQSLGANRTISPSASHCVCQCVGPEL